MTSRRSFIKVLAALPPALSLRRTWAAGPAAPDPARLALIIGNSAYRNAPLTNPANDAKAVGGLFTQAGFTVDSHLDATRSDMLGAIERFGATARRSASRLVVFYYAGHGAQLDWRNYLLPVDAVVEKQEHLKQRCIDLSLLLGQLSAAKDKTFVIILDACRNNPFGAAYRPEQKGLSQFDAPAGSLLAYATAPGNVASDGEGQNGLYTEHLVRELGQRGARIEDALKRVRLNVRLASNGAQIPWETTSLEGDVVIFNGGQTRLSEAEIETQLEADVAEWTRIKASKTIDDWVGYLRNFPNGRFAEIAQMRLNRLLAEAEKLAAEKRRQEEQKAREEQQRLEDDRRRLEQEKQKLATPVATAKPDPVQAIAPTAAPMLEIRAGIAVPTLIAPSANPFSAGRYPLNRIFTVGDAATVRISDILTGIEEQIRKVNVTRVDYDEDRVEYNNGITITDLMGNPIKLGRTEYDSPVQFTPAEFQVGKKWTAAFHRTRNGKASNSYFDMQITKRETISVPAGSFDTFRIEGEGWNLTQGMQLSVKLWLVPGINFIIRREQITRGRKGRFRQTERQELVALRQHAFASP